MLETAGFSVCAGAPWRLRPPPVPVRAQQPAVRRRRTGAPARKRHRASPRCAAGPGDGNSGGSGGPRFERGPDDRPESLDGDSLPTELTMSQQLLMRTYHEQIMRMNKQEVDKLCMEVLRQVIVKDNVLKMMGITATPWGQPPEPEDVDDASDEFGDDASDSGGRGGDDGSGSGGGGEGGWGSGGAGGPDGGAGGGAGLLEG